MIPAESVIHPELRGVIPRHARSPAYWTEILASYPSLKPEDINAALAYAAELAREGAMDLC